MKNDSAAKSKDLRNRAEQLLREGLKDLKERPAEDIQKVIHELQVHQIELEMQNEELRRTQLELHAERDKFSDLYDFALVGYFTISEKGMILEANFTGAAMLGVERGSLIHQPFSKFIDRDDQETFYFHRRELIETKTRQDCELRLIKKDGSQFYVRLECIVIEDAEGNIESIRAAVSDIEERKKDEEALKESERRFRTLVESAPHSILAVCDGKFVFANPAGARLHGYQSPHDMIGLDAIERVAPEFRDIIRERISKIEMDQKNPPIEFQILRRNGERVWFKSSSVVINFEGKPAALIFGRDISQDRRAEKERGQLLSAIEQACEVIVITGPEGNIQYANPAFERVTGYTVEEVKGKNPRIFKSGVQDEAFYRELWQTITNGKTWKNHIVNRRKDGSHYTEEASISPVLDKKGAITNFVAVKRDVTSEIDFEKRLAQAQKMEAIGTLAGGIAHDFNNILGAVIGLSQLSLLETVEDSSLHSNIEKILEAGMRAKGLVRQILAFSRQRDQAYIPMSISPVIKEAMKLIRSSLPRSIEIRQYIENVPELIEGDPTQIHQVVMNLCTNAEHAMREKGGVLDIKMGRVDVDEEMATLHHDLHPGSYVRLQVTDTGYGIEPAILERIFDPYFTTKGVGKGTGLGLAVVQGIVHKHGGAVHVESEPGKGTTFQVFFPVIEGEKKEIKEKREAPLPTGTERILFIDDEEVLAKIGKKILEPLGYKVTIRTSSTEALELIRAKPGYFDLVITDMTMPNMTGEQLSREVMKIRPELPIILCTGFSHIISEEKAREIGIHGFAMKPLGIKDLAEIVRRVLDQKNATFESR